MTKKAVRMPVKVRTKTINSHLRKGWEVDRENVAVNLADGWRRYVGLFQIEPRGTVKQLRAMLELASMDNWQTMKVDSQGGRKS